MNGFIITEYERNTELVVELTRLWRVLVLPRLAKHDNLGRGPGEGTDPGYSTNLDDTGSPVGTSVSGGEDGSKICAL